MNWTEKDRAREMFLQREGEGVVSREVYCCVSQLVADLGELEPDSDELMELSAPKCQTCEGTGGMDKCEDCDGTGKIQYSPSMNGETASLVLEMDCPVCGGKKLIPHSHRGGSPDESCDDCGGEGRFEAFEFWIVSEWIARKLREQGETVADDLHGLTVWARTTGQAICLDGSVRTIVEGMFAQELAAELAKVGGGS